MRTWLMVCWLLFVSCGYGLFTEATACGQTVPVPPEVSADPALNALVELWCVAEELDDCYGSVQFFQDELATQQSLLMSLTMRNAFYLVAYPTDAAVTLWSADIAADLADADVLLAAAVADYWWAAMYYQNALAAYADGRYFDCIFACGMGRYYIGECTDSKLQAATALQAAGLTYQVADTYLLLFGY